MQSRVCLGILTPSSNTVLEPVTTAMLAGLPEVSVHFSRFPVTQIALSAQALKQFDQTEILRAAELLSHAKVDVLSWNGTSAGWLGFEADRQLCAALTAATDIPACTSVLALNEIFALTGVRRFALVTPYTADVQQMIADNYRAAGYDCVADRHLGLRDNFSFSTVAAQTLREAVLSVAAAKPDAIAILCTNLRGAPLVAGLEAEIGIPIYDSVAMAVWKSLVVAGIEPGRVAGWGSVFSISGASPCK